MKEDTIKGINNYYKQLSDEEIKIDPPLEKGIIWSNSPYSANKYALNRRVVKTFLTVFKINLPKNCCPWLSHFPSDKARRPRPLEVVAAQMTRNI